MAWLFSVMALNRLSIELDNLKPVRKTAKLNPTRIQRIKESLVVSFMVAITLNHTT